MITHPKLTPVPIGLENLYYHMNGQVSLFKKITEENKKNTIFKKFRIFFAFNVGTNKIERQQAMDALSKNDMADNLKKATGVDARPDRIQRHEPIEQSHVLCARQRAGERLSEMMMRVHQPGQNHEIARGDYQIGVLRQFGGRADGGDRAVRNEDRSAADLAFVRIERGDQRRVAD